MSIFEDITNIVFGFIRFLGSVFWFLGVVRSGCGSNGFIGNVCDLFCIYDIFGGTVINIGSVCTFVFGIITLACDYNKQNYNNGPKPPFLKKRFLVLCTAMWTSFCAFGNLLTTCFATDHFLAHRGPFFLLCSVALS